MWFNDAINLISFNAFSLSFFPNPEIVGTIPYFEDFVSKCTYELGETENGKKISKIPENSRYIKSEEILYEIRKIEQDNVLQESIKANLAREIGLEKTKEFMQTGEGQAQFARFQFAQEKYGFDIKRHI